MVSVMKFKFNSIALLCCLLGAASWGQAATDGRVGATSTGQIFIRLQFNQSVQVDNLKDIELVVDDSMLTDGITTTQVFCVRGSQSGYYRLVAASDRGGAMPFSLRGDNEENVAYSLYFNGRLASNVLEPMHPGVPSQNYPVQSNGVACNGQDNAEIAIYIPANELRNRNSQVFSGYLNLTVAVE